MEKMATNLAVVALSLCLTAGAVAFSGPGSGTPLDPYIIADVNQLQEMNNALSAWYELGNDIDASSTHSGAGFLPVGDSTHAFTGHLDGNDFAVSGLYINRGYMDYVGLFACVLDGTVENIRLIDTDITGQYYTAVLVGFNDGGSINNCYCAGSVSGTNTVGGLVAYSIAGTINRCSSGATVNAWGDYCGGLAGNSQGTSISDCSSFGNVKGSNYIGGLVGAGGSPVTRCQSAGSVTGNECVGGLVGGFWNWGPLTDCNSAADVSGYRNVGGLTGYSYGTITKSFSTGTATGNYNVGGLTGYNGGSVNESFSTAGANTNGEDIGGFVGYNVGSITNCFAVGDVNGGDFVGGFAGENHDGTMANSYSAGRVTAPFNAGGFVGWSSDACNDCFWDTEASQIVRSACGTPKTTAEMKTQATFEGAGWDFATIWRIKQGETYPFLQVLSPTCGDAEHRYPVGDLNRDCRVNFMDIAVAGLHWLECSAPECD